MAEGGASWSGGIATTPFVALSGVQAHLLILDDLGDEVASVRQVCHDGHAHAQHQHIGVLLQEALHHGLHAHQGLSEGHGQGRVLPAQDATLSARTLAQAVLRALLSMRVQAVGAWHHVVPVVSGSLDQATKAVWLGADGRWASPIFLSLFA